MRLARSLLRLGLMALAPLALGLAGSLPALASGCSPPIARLAPALRLATYLVPAKGVAGEVGLTFLGHASFLIESPAGVTIVTDYNGVIRPPFTPDIVTMNHAHSTHYTDNPDPGIKLVLRGWDPKGGVPSNDVSFGDVKIHGVPTNIRSDGGTEYAGNSIFVFDVADLCIAHLSHLHHTLAPEHLAALGQIDVLLAPVDGTWTLGHEDMITVIEQIKPALVVPMHYFTTSVLKDFIAKTGGRYPVRWNESASTTLSRADLPARTEILVLPGGY